MMPVDYADWLTPERLEIEEALWASGKLYERYGAAVRRILLSYPDVKTVAEFGCGTGWVPTTLDDIAAQREGFTYTLVDRNEGCLVRARARNRERAWTSFYKEDIYELSPPMDLVCGFAVLKHLRLQGWRDIFIQLFKHARFGLFTVPLAEQCIDDGLEFPHVRVTRQFLYSAIHDSGHRVLWCDRSDPEEPLYAIGPLPVQQI